MTTVRSCEWTPNPEPSCNDVALTQAVSLVKMRHSLDLLLSYAIRTLRFQIFVLPENILSSGIWEFPKIGDPNIVP